MRGAAFQNSQNLMRLEAAPPTPAGDFAQDAEIKQRGQARVGGLQRDTQRRAGRHHGLYRGSKQHVQQTPGCRIRSYVSGPDLPTLADVQQVLRRGLLRRRRRRDPRQKETQPISPAPPNPSSRIRGF